MKNYSTFTNNFTYGRDLVKKLVIAAAIACVLGLLTQSNPTLQLIFVVASTLVFIYAIYTIIKYCRCPSCNKVIFFGLLAAKTARAASAASPPARRSGRARRQSINIRRSMPEIRS